MLTALATRLRGHEYCSAWCLAQSVCSRTCELPPERNHLPNKLDPEHPDGRMSLLFGYPSLPTNRRPKRFIRLRRQKPLPTKRANTGGTERLIARPESKASRPDKCCPLRSICAIPATQQIVPTMPIGTKRPHEKIISGRTFCHHEDSALPTESSPIISLLPNVAVETQLGPSARRVVGLQRIVGQITVPSPRLLRGHRLLFLDRLS